MLRTILAAAAMAVQGGAAPAQTGAPPPLVPADVEPAALALALARAPAITLDNGVVRAVFLKPDPVRGFYRGTRFDWSGMIASLRYRDREYYGPWFDRTASNVSDYLVDDGAIVAGPNSRAMGPAETFDQAAPPGWAEAAPGGTFVKIGVGVLRKPADGKPYSQFESYEIVDGGTWAVRSTRTRVEFVHTLTDRASGYGYVYRKTISLGARAPTMTIEHALTNTGTRAIATTLYNHNFLTIGAPVRDAGMTIALPFAAEPAKPPRGDALAIDGGTIRYVHALKDGETASVELRGYRPVAADYDLRVADASGAGYRVVGDRAMSDLAIWSIRSNVSVEPFLTIDATPGATARWRYAYTYLAGESR